MDTRFIANIFAISTFILIIIGYSSLFKSSVYGQTLSFYSASLVIFSFAYYDQNKYKFLLLMMIGLFGIYASMSRGVVVILSIVSLLSAREILSRKSFYYLITFSLLLFFSLGLDTFVQSFFLEKATENYGGSALDSLLASIDQRLVRVLASWEIAKYNLMLGRGLAFDYLPLMYEKIGYHQSAHNGFLDSLILNGLPVTIFVIFSFFIGYRVVKYEFGKIWSCFFIFYLLRGLGENYLIFSFGNMVSMIFIMLYAMILSNLYKFWSVK
ncbi:O-antigen ligase family protein [Vibrio breoganii]